MEKRPHNRLLGCVRQIVSTLELRTETDQELLQRFVGQRDEAAFAAVVRRHGPMVLRVALRIVQNEHDAEDVFQATFLVLSQKAHTLRRQESLGSWLYGIAYRLALKTKATAGERQNREKQVAAPPVVTPTAQITVQEAQTILDEELSRLPEKLREPVVLCCLEGLARDEAAQQIGCSTSVLKSRLGQGRERLRQRLVARGLTLPCGLGAFLLLEGAAGAAVLPALIGSTTKAAITVAAGKAANTVVTAKVAALTEGMIRTMFLTKMKIAVAALVLGCIVTGATVFTYRTAAAQGGKRSTSEERVKAPPKQEAEQDKAAFTAWGKEVGGLQAGLGYHSGQKRVYHHGETVTLVIRVRNVGKEKVRLHYYRDFFMEIPPSTKPPGVISGIRSIFSGEWELKELDLAPGQEVEINTPKVKLRPASERDADGDPNGVVPTLWGTGTFRIRYERLAPKTIDNVMGKLATGELELEIKTEKPPEKKKKAPDAPVPAAAQKDKAKENAGPVFKMRVHIEKVNAGSRSINAYCPIWGVFDGVTKPSRFEHLSVSENAKLKHNGKDLKFSDLKPKTDVLLELEAASEFGLMVVGIEAGESKLSQGIKRKPFRMRVHIEKVNTDSRSITASCMILGKIDNVFKPQRFDHLDVSENAKIKHNGKDLKLTDLKPGTGVLLELEAASEWSLMVVGIEALGKTNPSVDAGRLGEGDKGLVTKDTQKAIDAGLAYLAKEQHDDGSFGTGVYNGNVAVTSLAGLAFLSGGPNPDQGEYGNGKAVTKTIRNVLSFEDKNIPGLLSNPKAEFHGPMFSHGFAVHFLADSYATTKDKKLKAEIKEPLERAVKLIVNSQNDEGGWRYYPRKSDAELDMTALQVIALRAASDAGIDVPNETFDRAIKYVKSCQDQDSGGFRYMAFGGAPLGFARSAAGLLSLNRLGIKEGDEIERGVAYLEKFGPKKRVGGGTDLATHYLYGHFFAAKAMSHAGDNKWEVWYPGIRDELLQDRKNGTHWESGLVSPHYCTSIALIILQTPQKHLPSMKR